MKLSSLTPQDKIKLAAELDGWKDVQYNCVDGRIDKTDGIIGKHPSSERFERCFRYDKYYDAIIPLIQKQPYEVRQKCIPQSLALLPYDFTPSQLLDALLVATGKAEL